MKSCARGLRAIRRFAAPGSTRPTRRLRLEQISVGTARAVDTAGRERPKAEQIWFIRRSGPERSPRVRFNRTPQRREAKSLEMILSDIRESGPVAAGCPNSRIPRRSLLNVRTGPLLGARCPRTDHKKNMGVFDCVL